MINIIRPASVDDTRRLGAVKIVVTSKRDRRTMFNAKREKADNSVCAKDIKHGRIPLGYRWR